MRKGKVRLCLWQTIIRWTVLLILNKVPFLIIMIHSIQFLHCKLSSLPKSLQCIARLSIFDTCITPKILRRRMKFCSHNSIRLIKKYQINLVIKNRFISNCIKQKGVPNRPKVPYCKAPQKYTEKQFIALPVTRDFSHVFLCNTIPFSDFSI